MIEQLRKHLREWDDIQNKIHDLWSWLPSHTLAKLYHGDQYHHFQPSADEIASEACKVFASLMSEDVSFLLVCPCGETHWVFHKGADLRLKDSFELGYSGKALNRFPRFSSSWVAYFEGAHAKAEGIVIRF